MSRDAKLLSQFLIAAEARGLTSSSGGSTRALEGDEAFAKSRQQCLLFQ
jgi:hypothetical protein